MKTSPALRPFRGVLGLPCWGVKAGFGSCLSLEFGDPRLVVREPEPEKAEAASTSRVRRLWSRRHIQIAGDWHLWIYCCNWLVRDGQRTVGDSTSPSRIRRALQQLDGQRLTAVTLAPRGAGTIFSFDLGATITTRPYDSKSEQWMPFTPGGKVLTLRADRRYTFHRANATRGHESWHAA